MTILSKATTLVSSLLAMNSTTSTPKEYIELEIIEEKTVTPDIVIRPGEYPNKPGKRVYINPASLSIPDDIPIHTDENGTYIHEYDINKKLSLAIVRKLKALGVDAELQLASSKSQDLNSAGRIAKATGTKAYLSVHHDCYNGNAKGYHFITNEGDTDATLAQRLSESIANGAVPTRANATNNGYIGELNQTGDIINILGEFGFFDNLEELQNIISDEQVDYVSTQIANELAIILK